jgi:hypothetical protein
MIPITAWRHGKHSIVIKYTTTSVLEIAGIDARLSWPRIVMRACWTSYAGWFPARRRVCCGLKERSWYLLPLTVWLHLRLRAASTGAEHPRLDVILSSERPVQFPPTVVLADPFDGLLDSAGHPAPARDDSCMSGVRLTEGGEVVGALTADARDPQALR